MSGIQFMLETEFGKAIAILVVTAVALIAAGVLKMYTSWSDFFKALNENAMSIAVLIVVAFVAIQLIGDGAMGFYDGSIEDTNVPPRVREVKIMNFVVGLVLALLCFIVMYARCGVCSKAAGRVRGAMPRNPFAGFGKALGFGRRRKKRRC